MIASAPSQPSADSAARILGTMPPAMTPVVDEVLRLGDGQRVELAAVGVADAVDVGQQDQLARAEPGRDAGGGIVGVDVADDPVRVAGERRDDRDLAADTRTASSRSRRRPVTLATSPSSRDPLGDQQPAVDAGQADRVDAEVAQPGDELAVDDAAQDRGGDLERLGVGHAQAALELRRHAEALEPLGDALAAAVDEHDRPPSRDGRDVREHCPTARRSSCRRA